MRGVWKEIWQQYARNFWGMQLVIALVFGGAWLRTHRLSIGLGFLVVMEISAVLGAMWGVRLKRKLSRMGGHGTRLLW